MYIQTCAVIRRERNRIWKEIGVNCEDYLVDVAEEAESNWPYDLQEIESCIVNEAEKVIDLFRKEGF